MEDNQHKEEDHLFYGCFYLIIWKDIKTQRSWGRMPTVLEWSSDPGGGQEVEKRIKTIREGKRAKGRPISISKATSAWTHEFFDEKISKYFAACYGLYRCP